MCKFLKSLFNKKETSEVRVSSAYVVALGEIGVKEIPGAKHNDKILAYHSTAGGHSTDEIAWCSSFMNWCHLKANLPRTGSAAARSWAGIGKDVTKSPREGDIVVLRRIDSSWRGHVGFFVSMTKTHIKMLGGNQGNEVNITSYPIKSGNYRLLSIRRV